jgi:hypothetical protein
LEEDAATTAATATAAVSPWPHHLDLTLTFDSRPEEVSWKVDNHVTGTLLAGVPFGEYGSSSSSSSSSSSVYANTTIVIQVDILTEDDYGGGGEGGYDPMAMREYRFVIYDRVRET